MGTAGQVLAGTAGAPAWTSSPALSGNLTLADSTWAFNLVPLAGYIMKGNKSFISNRGSLNTFIGELAGEGSLLRGEKKHREWLPGAPQP